jgi:hypothetical protein
MSNIDQPTPENTARLLIAVICQRLMNRQELNNKQFQRIAQTLPLDPALYESFLPESFTVSDEVLAQKLLAAVNQSSGKLTVLPRLV